MSYVKKTAILGIGILIVIPTIFTPKILEKERFARWTCFFLFVQERNGVSRPHGGNTTPVLRKKDMKENLKEFAEK